MFSFKKNIAWHFHEHSLLFHQLHWLAISQHRTQKSVLAFGDGCQTPKATPKVLIYSPMQLTIKSALDHDKGLENIQLFVNPLSTILCPNWFVEHCDFYSS